MTVLQYHNTHTTTFVVSVPTLSQREGFQNICICGKVSGKRETEVLVDTYDLNISIDSIRETQ